MKDSKKQKEIRQSGGAESSSRGNEGGSFVAKFPGTVITFTERNWVVFLLMALAILQNSPDIQLIQW